MPSPIHPSPFVIRPPADLLVKQPDLRRMASQLANRYADGELVTDQHLQTIGSALWDALALPQADFNAAIVAAGAIILPVIIATDAAAVQALPWETLFHPVHGFIGRHPAFTLSRQLTAPIAAQTTPLQALEKGPLRVMLFTSLPDDVDAEYGRLKLEEEQAQVQEALLPWIAKGIVQLEMPDDGRFSTLQAMLTSFQPHFLFLSGHGSFHHEPHTGEAPYGAFFFESEIGDSEAVKQDAIARALVGIGVQAVVLSACESSKTTPASEALNHGLAQCISAHGIAYVIGMRESIYDVTGIQFARALCDALAGGERIDYALQAARIAIQTPFKSAPQHETGPDGTAELSYGQWCLPMLISSNLHNALIDWNFQATPIANVRLTKTTLGDVKLPERFIGRRSEMRQYKNRMAKGELHSLLITAPGGQGKTSLAGKLALDMQQRGWQVFAWSARPEKPWREFLLKEMQMTLDKARGEQYDKYRAQATDEFARAEMMYKLLMAQFNGRVILFLDNLESIQNPDTRDLTDAVVAAWLAAARSTPGLILLATSRWHLPGWEGEHLTLAHANYGDFLQMAQRLNLPVSLFEKHELRRVYEVLGGNSRGLEFFAAAVATMQDVDEEKAFLEKLAQVKEDLQANMAIEEIVSRLPADAQKLLQRLPAYAEPVPVEGIIKLGLDLPEPEALLGRLLAVSLLEAGYEPHWQVVQYQCSPLVADWLRQRGLLDEAEVHLNAVADYQLYLFRNERHTLGQAIAAHHALRRAARHTEADRLTLDTIVEPMIMAGFYATLLTEWLPRICEAEDAQTRAEALGQTGKINHQLGDYETALDDMEKALLIMQKIGDKAGEGITLNNISQTYQAQGDYDTTRNYLKQALTSHRKTGNKAGEGTTLNNISLSYQAQGDFATAHGYLKQALIIQQKIGDIVGEGTTLNNISQIYQAQGDHLTTLSYLKQALTIHQQTGNKASEGFSLSNISIVYQALGDYQTALDYQKQSLTIRQEIGDKAGEGASLNNIATLHYSLGDYESALGYQQESLMIMQQIGNKAGEAATFNNISQVYTTQGDYALALGYLEQALTIQRQIGNKEGLCATLFNIGLNQYQNKQMQEAINTWTNVYTVAKQINLAQALQVLSQLAPQLFMPEGLEGWEQLSQEVGTSDSLSAVISSGQRVS